MLEDLMIAVPGDATAVEQLRSRLNALGLVGWIIDGAVLGHDGWVLARIAADDEGALTVDAAGDLNLLEADEVRQLLTDTWPQVQVGEVVIDGADVAGPVCQSLSAPLYEVAVARAKGMGLELEAVMEGLSLSEVQVGDRVVFGRTQPIEGVEHELLETFTTAKGGSVVLWRRDPHVMVAVLERSEMVELHVFEPPWTPVGPAAQDELRAELRPAQADVARIVEVLDLPPESLGRLQEILDRVDPPLDELCDLLKLPLEALRVISGECAVEDLPGAVVHQPEDVSAATKSSDDDPKWVRWVDEGQRELKWWYLVWSLVVLWVFGNLVVRWLNGGSLFWALLGAAGVILTVKDLVDRWRAKRSRSA